MTFRDRLALYETLFWFCVTAVTIVVLAAYLLAVAGRGVHSSSPGQDPHRPSRAHLVQPRAAFVSCGASDCRRLSKSLV
jgi:hypothetical protein